MLDMNSHRKIFHLHNHLVGTGKKLTLMHLGLRIILAHDTATFLSSTIGVLDTFFKTRRVDSGNP